MDQLKPPVTRRDFLRVGASTAAALLASACGFSPAAPTPTRAPSIPKDTTVSNPQVPQQGEIKVSTETVSRLSVMTVKDALAKTNNDPKLVKTLGDTTRLVYGAEKPQDDDWIVAVSKPPEGKSTVVTLLGITAAGSGKGKGKSPEVGMHIQFQRRADTKPDAVLVDNMHPDADIVHKVAGTADYFFPYSPGSEANVIGWKGWAPVNFPDGTPRPVMTPLAEATDSLMLFIPTTSLRAAGYSPDVAKVSAQISDLAFPARD